MSYSVMNQRGGMREGREAQEGGNIFILMADYCCTAEYNIVK